MGEPVSSVPRGLSVRVSPKGGAAALLTLAVAASGAFATWAAAAPAGDIRAPQQDVWASRARTPTLEVVRRVGVIDGDTFVARRPGSKREIIVRNAGIQAMEDGECGKKQAKKRLSRLLGKKVVIASRTNQARPNGLGIWRLQRNVFTKSGRDVQAAMLKSGLVLPYGIGRETLRQAMYATLAQKAALAGRGLFSGTYCRSGPVQSAPLDLKINYDASGDDWLNLSSKFVRIRNLGPVPVPVGKWRLRAAAHDSFYFPLGAVIPAYGDVVVRLGSGVDTATTFYWEGDRMRFFVPGQSRYQGGGGYLFDRDGDIRAWSMYPCRVNCRHPARGTLKGRVARGVTPPAPQPDESESSASPSTSQSPIESPSSDPSPLAQDPSDTTSQSPSYIESTPPTVPTPPVGRDPDRDRERVWFTNTSERRVDLSYTVLRIRGHSYEFPVGTVVDPGEELVIFTGAGVRTRLRHFLGLPEPFLFGNPLGATARIRTHDTIRIACVDWGKQECRP